MTRRTGQITPIQALLGAVIVVAVAAGIVEGLGQLVARGEQLPSLEAPAQDEADEMCPEAIADSAPVEVTASDLIECPSSFDGVAVSYRGEAVRAVLDRGDRAWVHLNDDPYALQLGPLPEHRTAVGGNSGIPVSIPASSAANITHVGDARHRGDIIAVTGTFYRANPADGGGPSIEADTAEIVRRGRVTSRPVNNARTLTTSVICIAALTIALIARREPEPRPPS
jgi:hypothetical protein